MLPQLDPTWYVSQLFWLVVSVVFMHFMLKHSVLPRLMAMIEGRETFKSVAITEAESFKRSAEEVRARYEQALAEARARSQQVFADADANIRDLSATTQKQMDQTINAKVSEAQTRIRSQTEQFKQELQAGAGELVADIVERFSGARPDGTKTANALRAVN